MAIEPLLDARNLMRKQKAIFGRRLGQMARKDEVCKRLMTVSGVGPIVSLLLKATISGAKLAFRLYADWTTKSLK